MRNPDRLFLMLCFLMLGGRAVSNAQTVSVPEIEAYVPFAFVVGDTRLPAGKYLIRTVDANANDVLEISSAREGAVVVFDTVGGKLQGAEVQRKTKLVFDVVEGHYFLAEIWLAGRSTGNELTESRIEKKLTDGGSLVERQAVIAILKPRTPK